MLIPGHLFSTHDLLQTINLIRKTGILKISYFKLSTLSEAKDDAIFQIKSYRPTHGNSVDHFAPAGFIIRPILRVSQRLQDAAEGESDLTKRITTGRIDEIGVLADWFNRFVYRINNIIGDINNNSETVSSSSLEVLTTSEEIQEKAKTLSSNNRVWRTRVWK